MPLAGHSKGDDAGSAISRYPGLDGVRGIAILLVLALHFGVAADFPRQAPSGISRWLERIFYLGWSGVDLFFVLSGFLITSILLASKAEPRYFRKFYGRRALRILPLHYVAIALGLFVVPAVFPDRAAQLLGDARSGQIWLWTYSLNIAFSLGWLANAGVFAQFWTLAIEEQYYLVWPWIVKYASRGTLLTICGALVVESLAFRLAWIAVRHDWEGAYHFTLARVDALAVGGAIAVLANDERWRLRLDRLAPAGLMIGVLAIGAMFLRFPRFYPSEWLVVTFGHSILALTFGCFVVVALRDPGPNWMRARWLELLGKYSYGIYVWHWPVQRVLLDLYGSRRAPTPALGATEAAAFLMGGALLSVCCGWASYKVIEQPFLRLKRFFSYDVDRDALEPTAGAAAVLTQTPARPRPQA
jgi:peptidoglycan/LPS O-acetylase OafA/YrhL